MKEYKFVLTENEANLVLNALAECPYKVVAPLIAKLQQQAAAQTDEPGAAAKVDGLASSAGGLVARVP
jgi:hypothetical protein